MSTLRSPTGSGSCGKSDSFTNLSIIDSKSEFNDNIRVSLRNKRKQLDDSENLGLIHNDVAELSKQMKEVMSMLTVLTTNQKDFIDKVSLDIKAIKEEITDIKVETKKLSDQQNAVQADMDFLKTKHSETDAKIQVLECEIAQCKSTIQAPPMTSSLETILAEIKDRESRTKNIIVIGVAESHLENVEDSKNADKDEILRITRIADPDCANPINITRLGKINASKNRPIRVSYDSEKTAISILRKSKNIKSDTIKLFSDQTPLQQANKKALKEELKRRIENGEKDIAIKYVKGKPIIKKLLTKN